MNNLPSDLSAITAEMLTPMVRGALRRGDVVINEWHYEAFGHSLDEVYGQERAIIRFSGTALDRDRQDRSAPWALVLKIVTAPGTPGDPTCPDNGDREPLAYTSGLLDGLRGLRTPRCFGVMERPGARRWLWLEDIVDEIGQEWPAERYSLAARHLAQFNAAYPASRGDVSHAWLSRSPLRNIVNEASAAVECVSDMRGNPFVAVAISPLSASALVASLRDSAAWLDALDSAPQVLCHWDAHRANLFSRTTRDGEVETVAIDWAGIGWGPVGSDLSRLLSTTVNFFGMDVDTLPALDTALFEQYLEGLRESGWEGDHKIVRFGYVATSAIRLLDRTTKALHLASDVQARGAFERATGLPFGSIAEKFGQTLPHYLSHADEARRLVGLVRRASATRHGGGAQ
jgi:hypothetical protein